MKIKKILISLLFFSNLFLLDSFHAKTSKAIAVLSAISLSSLHNYIISLDEKKPLIDTLLIEKSEKSLSQEIYNEVFSDIPIIDILTSLYKEGPLSHSDVNINNDSTVMAKNCNLFTDALFASFFVQEFINKINEKKKFSNIDQKSIVASFSIGVIRGLVYSLLEEEIHDYVSIIPFLKKKKMLTTLVSSALNIVITKGLFNKILYRGIDYVFVKKTNSKLSSASSMNGFHEDAMIQEKNEKEEQVDIKASDFVEVVDLGTLQAKILIYLIKVVDHLRK